MTGRVATQSNDQFCHQMVQFLPPNGARQAGGDGVLHYCFTGRRVDSLQTGEIVSAKDIGFRSSAHRWKPSQPFSDDPNRTIYVAANVQSQLMYTLAS